MSHGYFELPSGRVAAIDGNCAFPPAHLALTEPNGLVAIGGDLNPSRLLDAYRQGIFPWFNAGDPILWWSPDPRMVLFPNQLKISRSLSKKIKSNAFETHMNTSFQAVITACAQTQRHRQSGTWITSEMITAYCELHRLGYAICAESWQNGKLVGGCYGIKIGRAFFGESMFHHASDASKVAFVFLVNHLIDQGVEMIDCQMETQHLASLGAMPLARLGFLQKLQDLVD